MSYVDWALAFLFLLLFYCATQRLLGLYEELLVERWDSEREEEVRMEVVKLRPEAITPSKARFSDAAYDIYAMEDVVIPPKTQLLVSTGIAIAPPLGWYYTVNPRSGNGVRGILPMRGIIDTGYTGEVKIVVYNHADTPFTVQRGNRIAQLTPHRVTRVDFHEVGEFSEAYSLRGSNGWGSSGK